MKTINETLKDCGGDLLLEATDKKVDKSYLINFYDHELKKSKGKDLIKLQSNRVEVEELINSKTISTFDELDNHIKDVKLQKLPRKKPEYKTYTEKQVEKIAKDSVKDFQDDMGDDFEGDEYSFVVDMSDSMLRDDKLLKSVVKHWDIEEFNKKTEFEKAKYIFADVMSSYLP